MEEKLASILNKDEQLLWVGRSQSEKTMVGPYRANLLLRWAVCALLAIALCVLYFSAVPSSGVSVSTAQGLLIFSVLFLLVIAVRPLLDKRTLEKKAVYAVTDQRVLLIHTGIMGAEIKAELLRGKLGKVQSVPAADGLLTLLFGSSVGLSASKHRMLGAFGNRVEDTPGPVFYRISDGARVMELLHIDPAAQPVG